jgi:hypothetical protein
MTPVRASIGIGIAVTLTLTLTLTLALAACDVAYEPEVGAPLAGGCESVDSDPATAVSFRRDIRPLFDRPRMEAGCSCHRPARVGVELSGFDMTTIETIRRGGANSGQDIVVPGDPCASLLVHKISDAPPFGARMTLDGPPYLGEAEQQLVRDWIAEGAEDN